MIPKSTLLFITQSIFQLAGVVAQGCDDYKRNDILTCRNYFGGKMMNSVSIFNKRIMTRHCDVAWKVLHIKDNYFRIVGYMNQCEQKFPECLGDAQLLSKYGQYGKSTSESVANVYKILCDKTFLDEHFPCILTKMGSESSCKWNASDPSVAKALRTANSRHGGNLNEDAFCSALNFYLSCIEGPVEKHCGRPAASAIMNVLFYSARFVPNCVVVVKNKSEYQTSAASPRRNLQPITYLTSIYVGIIVLNRLMGLGMA